MNIVRSDSMQVRPAKTRVQRYEKIFFGTCEIRSDTNSFFKVLSKIPGETFWLVLAYL